MTKIVLFVEHEFQGMLDAMGLSDDKTKSFGNYVIIKSKEKGDVNKLISGKIVAAYCNGEVAFKHGIKALSDGTNWIHIDSYKIFCEELLSENEENQKRDKSNAQDN